MELKVNPNGKVPFLLKSGKDLVRGEMLEAEAKDLISKGKVKEEKGKIIVDDKFIFMDEDAEEELFVEKKENKKEEKKEEKPKKTVKKDVPLSEVAKKSSKKKLTDNANKEPLSSKPLTKKSKKK